MKTVSQYNKAIAGALVPIIVWLLARYGVELPTDVQAALTVILTTGAVYAVPNGAPPTKDEDQENEPPDPA